MNVSPNEAEEALEAINRTMEKTRHTIVTSGAYISLIATGTIWLIGFLCTQFLPANIVGYLWGGLSVAGTLVATILGRRRGRRVRSPSTAATARRIGSFWILLAILCLASIAVAWPVDGKQLVLYIFLFIISSQLAMGLLLSFGAVGWSLPIAALLLTILVLSGYFLLPAYFYLIMAFLGGGGMILFGLYIRSRW